MPGFTRNWLAKSRRGARLPAAESAWTASLREPLLFVLHLGYVWLALGLVLVGLDASSAALHALTVGAIGTMTLAVMTRASLGHTGRALSADGATIAIYVLVTLAALLRVLSPLAGAHAVTVNSLAGLAWSGAFGTFALHYGRFLIQGIPYRLT
ncbi:MAG TPA: NnrS family protein [Burkholderiales bacterium]|nr:NnrS family protein [Burkholderiales bacterium]